MSFIQIMEFTTADQDAMSSFADEWQQATEGRRTTQRVIVGRHRDDPDRYVNVVFFDSYESAMENNALPETQALAERMGQAVKGDVVFHDLDVIEDRTP
jgi:hypothetical protein